MPIGAAITRLQALDKAAAALGRVEAEILAAHVFGCTRTALYAAPGETVDPRASAQLDQLVAERLSGRPLQYITGFQEFRRLHLRVGPGVLVPRPETELVVEECLTLLQGVRSPRVIDVGTGSGAIALSIATERPDSRVWATDISEEALAWARLNSEGIKNVELVRGDLFSGLPSDLLGTVDLVVSNPPYLSDVEMSDAPVDVRNHEPALALSGGAGGLEVPARIVRDAEAWLSDAGWLVLETSPTQAGQLRELFLRRFEEVHIVDDLAGRARIAWGRKPSPG